MNPAGKTILIAGASGLSGRGAARLLCDLGAKVVLSDRNPEPRAPEELAGREFVDLRGRADGNEAGLLDEVKPEALVTAPGVPLAGALFVEARRRGLPIYGENDLAFELIRSHWERPPFVIGVTGTDGKSTTTALLANLIEAATGLAAIPAGNYGRPLSLIFDDQAAREGAPTVLVVECSSFQLEPALYFHPEIAMILNVADDHLDRYPDLDAYLDAKLNILRNATADDLFLAPAEIVAAARGRYGDQLLARASAVACRTPADLIEFDGTPLLPAGEAGLRGDHNLCNIRYALIALADICRRTGVSCDREKLAAALRSFQGLEHRMEPCGAAGRLEFINDSKATTVHAVESAVASLVGTGAGGGDSNRGRLYLLCGGRDKGVDFSALGRLPVRIFPYGEAAGLIARAVSADTEYENLSTAFAAAREVAWRETEAGRRSGTLLLSPGCASFDEFGNYGERGERFKELVRDFIGSTEKNESGEGVQV